MAMFILLDANQAASVRGVSTPSAALDPVEREGGVFVLGAEVLADLASPDETDLLASHRESS